MSSHQLLFRKPYKNKKHHHTFHALSTLINIKREKNTNGCNSTVCLQFKQSVAVLDLSYFGQSLHLHFPRGILNQSTLIRSSGCFVDCLVVWDS